jgi:methionyl-tRNA formyltransferase
MRIVMLGTGTFAEPTFEALIRAFPGEVVGLVTQPDRDSGRKGGSSRMVGKGMASIAAGAGIPLAQPANINSPEGLAELTAMTPDLLVVAAYGQILKPAVIGAGPLGAINVHGSLLPKYRGAAPVAHAILGGETVTGVTIIRITPGLDAGEMLAQESLDILPDETAGELEFRLAPVGARLAVETVTRLKAGPVTGTAQDAEIAKRFRAPKLTKDMGLIDWSKPADEIGRHVRAMQPWPTAYTYLYRPGKEATRVMLTLVRPHETKRDSEPGTATSDGSELHVTAGSSSVVNVIELQPAGKKKMSAAEFLRGHALADGSRFGPERLS